MRLNISIYNSLVTAPQLEDAVRALSDAELRSVRGFLARGEIESWPTELVHGVCIIESSERFMNQRQETETEDLRYKEVAQ